MASVRGLPRLSKRSSVVLRCLATKIPATIASTLFLPSSIRASYTLRLLFAIVSAMHGFRSLAVIEHGRSQLVSRKGHPFNSFENLRKGLTSHYHRKTVLDGEIVCLDRRGRPQ